MTTQNLRTPRRTGALAAAALLAGAAFAAFGPGLAAAAAVDDVPSLTVNYGDLNLDTDGGARTLYARLRSAAARVCPVGLAGDLSSTAAEQRCRERAIAQAVARINNARLTKLVTSRARGG